MVAAGVFSGSSSVLRISRADGAGVRIHIAGGAEVVSLGAVRIRRYMRRHIGPAAGDVSLEVWPFGFDPVPRYCAWAAVAASAKAAAIMSFFIPQPPQWLLFAAGYNHVAVGLSNARPAGKGMSTAIHGR